MSFMVKLFSNLWSKYSAYASSTTQEWRFLNNLQERGTIELMLEVNELYFGHKILKSISCTSHVAKLPESKCHSLVDELPLEVHQFVEG